MQESVHEAIYRYFYKDEEALLQLISYFRPVTISILYDFLQGRKIDDASRNEYLVMADEALVNCLMNCRTDQYYSFKAYYKVVYRHVLIDTIRRDKMNRLKQHYQIVSLDECVHEDNYHYMSDYVKDPNMNVHESVMVDLMNAYIENQLRKHFSDFECQIVQLRRKGFTNREIAQMHSITTRKVRYILTKIKNWYMSR